VLSASTLYESVRTAMTLPLTPTIDRTPTVRLATP
jgi:hypothetical protein